MIKLPIKSTDQVIEELAKRLPELPQGKHELMLPTPYKRFWQQTAGRRGKRYSSRYVLQLTAIIIIMALFMFFITSDTHHRAVGYFSPLFNVLVWGLVLSQAYKFLAAPNHLQIGAQGLRFHWLGTYHLITSKWVDWTAIQSVNVSNKAIGLSGLQIQAIDIGIDMSKVSGSSLAALLFMSPLYWLRNGLRNYTFTLFPQAMSLENDTQSFIASLRAFLPEEKLDASLTILEGSGLPSYTLMWLNQLRSTQGSGNQLDPLNPGHSLYEGKYRVVERIAAGGQAITYKAEDSEQQTVALKEFVMPTRGGMEIKKRALENVEHEAQLLKKLDHDQIVKLLDFFVESQRAYLVLEYIDGQSLRKLVQANGPFDQGQVTKMALAMSDILLYLHQHTPPIVHRDFTPDNLLLSKEGKLVLIDFNVAEQLEIELSKGVAGKHAYIPPEQFRGEAKAQSDIYAMGATMHYLLTGQDPEPISVSHPAAGGGKISAALDEIVARATATELQKRYSDCAALRADLERLALEPCS